VTAGGKDVVDLRERQRAAAAAEDERLNIEGRRIALTLFYIFRDTGVPYRDYAKLFQRVAKRGAPTDAHVDFYQHLLVKAQKNIGRRRRDVAPDGAEQLQLPLRFIHGRHDQMCFAEWAAPWPTRGKTPTRGPADTDRKHQQGDPR
jgi:hypothetical protein